MHRLNAIEYDNTINELFGLTQHVARDTFIPDEKGTTGFDNEAAALTMTAAEFQQYFSAADAIVEHFKQIVASALVEVLQAPVVQQQDVHLRKLSQSTGEAAVAVRNFQFLEQPGNTDIEY